MCDGFEVRVAAHMNGRVSIIFKWDDSEVSTVAYAGTVRRPNKQLRGYFWAVQDLSCRAAYPSNEDVSGADGAPKIWHVGALVRTSTASAEPTLPVPWRKSKRLKHSRRATSSPTVTQRIAPHWLLVVLFSCCSSCKSQSEPHIRNVTAQQQ
jgi:hypothetical protein